LSASGASSPAGIAGHLRDHLRRVRDGDIGSLPAIAGLLIACVIFSVVRPVFFTAGNFANLFTQGAGIIVIAMGLVFVLLLGEIDLSAGVASGVCAAVLAVLLVNHHWPWYAAILAAIATGMVIGLTLGVLVVKVGIPSFVVTLAAFLAFQGIALLLIKGGENIAIDDRAIRLINFDGKLPPVLGWVMLVVSVCGFAAVQVLRRVGRIDKGLVVDPLSVIALRVAVVAAVLGATVYVLNLERARNPAIASQRGVPVVVLVLAGLLMLWTVVLTRTAYGRHIYAVGGNREAARRAGINVDRIRISVFVICSGMAAVGGVIVASRASSVDPNTGGSNTLLYAVAAAVIGGTSLFGGKGRVLDAVVGGALVAVIENGMGLMNYNAGRVFIVTGSVLLLAAGVDALSRKRASSAGLR
jgi:D-xylose transport system permease protein